MARHGLPAAGRAIGCIVLVSLFALIATSAQQAPRPFGGAYSGLDERRQRLVQDWVGRFNRTTGQPLDVGPFYDEVLGLSAKTTFDAVTHALMTTALTDASGAPLGDALALVGRVDSVRGEVVGASGDRQFRMYVTLTPEARAVLERSRQFKRGMDNTVYHKGYPLSYREQGETPSIQISIAQDGRRADVDVDYRSSSFPAALFNGHLTAANSDVRAGNNSERHAARWAGLQTWWRSFFGVRLKQTPEAPKETTALEIPTEPRTGRKDIDIMVDDFLRAWLVEGDVVAAMGFISERAYGCMARDQADLASFDRGMAPYQLMINLKAAHESAVKVAGSEAPTVGIRLALPALKVVSQPGHARFVIYSVPADLAAGFDCESRLAPTARNVARNYGDFYGTTFYVRGNQDVPVALLWAREGRYWKIVSWKVGLDVGPTTPADPEEAAAPRVKADASFVEASRTFLQAWLIRKDYDAAFRYFSDASHGCYNLERGPAEPAATSLEEAGRKIRLGVESIGGLVGNPRALADVISAAEPRHPAVRVMDHAASRTFSLTSLPSAIGDAVECAARARQATLPDPLPLEYGKFFGLTFRFRTTGGEAPVLQLMWRQEAGAWRITAYAVEMP